MTEPPDENSAYSEGHWQPVRITEGTPVAPGEMVVPPWAVDEFCRRLREGDK